jgi:hypothetical protein
MRRNQVLVLEGRKMYQEFFVRGSCRLARLSAAAFASFAAVVLMAALPVRADVYWTLSPSQTGDWSMASNWGGTAPTSSVNAYIINGGTATITLPGATCNCLYLGDPNSTNAGTIQMSGGSLSVLSYEYLGNNGTGTFTQSGGTNSFGVSYLGGLYLGCIAGSTGAYNLGGSGVLSGYSESVGYS